ncbi:MAG: copper resistance protein CopC [Longimicrobiaceae bacterium]
MKRAIRRAPGARTMAAAVVMAVLCAASAAPASARGAFHLRLLRSDPAADATLAAPPRALRLTFSEAPELAVTSVRLRGPGDGAVALSALARQRGDRATVVATPRAPLADGHYTVTWRTMSHDGHPMHGTFHFAVGGHAH